jgi:hypothetical protein
MFGIYYWVDRSVDGKLQGKLTEMPFTIRVGFIPLKSKAGKQ